MTKDPEEKRAFHWGRTGAPKQETPEERQKRLRGIAGGRGRKFWMSDAAKVESMEREIAILLDRLQAAYAEIGELRHQRDEYMAQAVSAERREKERANG